MPFAKEEWHDRSEWTIKREEKDRGRERVGEKIVTGEVVNGRLQYLVSAPLPEGPDDNEAGKDRRRAEDAESDRIPAQRLSFGLPRAKQVICENCKNKKWLYHECGMV